MLRTVLSLLLSYQLVQIPGDEIRSALAHAEALYYGARFNDAIQLLERIDDLLETRPARPEDKLATKLQLALSHIALNNNASAKSFLVEVFELDENYRFDPKQFSPKVLELAEQAKAEKKKRICVVALADGRKSIAASDPSAVITLIDSLEVACPELNRVADEAADIAYKIGLEAYRNEDLPVALERFQMASNLSSSHEMAAQYVELTRGKLQIAAGRLALQWQREFDSRQWKLAAGTYQKIAGLPSTEDTVASMNTAYLKALGPLVDSWNLSCSRNDEPGMAAIRTQVTDLVPNPDFGSDIRAKMTPCARPAPIQQASTQLKPQSAAPKATECLQMAFAQALPRLKDRVYPEITPQLSTFLRNSQVAVGVKVRINPDGSVTPLSATGGNPMLNEAVSNAVAKWTFSPIRDQSGVRCVNTEIMINLSITN